MWENLSMRDKAAFMQVAIKNGLYGLEEIKNKYNEYAEGGPIEYNTNLPEVEVTANTPRRYLTLNTYYPIESSLYPFTGHSSLTIPSSFAKDIDGNNQFVYKGGTISKTGRDKDYNLITNNCSDATRECLESVFNKKLNPFLFTTPGDVRDFAIESLKGIPEVKGDSIFNKHKGKYELRTSINKYLDKQIKETNSIYIPVNKHQYEKAINFLKNKK